MCIGARSHTLVDNPTVHFSKMKRPRSLMPLGQQPPRVFRKGEVKFSPSPPPVKPPSRAPRVKFRNRRRHQRLRPVTAAWAPSVPV